MLRSGVHGAWTLLSDGMLVFTLLRSFVQLQSDETEMYIDWSGTSKRIEKLPCVTLRIPYEHDEECVVLNGEDGVFKHQSILNI